MLIRLRYGRRLQTYLKIGACVVVGLCYFAFLFRESLNAYEHRERISAAELEADAEPSKQQLKIKRQQLQRQRILAKQPGYDVKFLQRTETQPLELARKRYPRPELGELMELLPSALSFLFVRDPFERILSAYRNKLEGNKNTFYKTLGTKIVHRYRKRNLGGPWPRCGPTFEEFVRFLIGEQAAGKRFDEHWAPIYSFCTPCSVNFTIIGKTETFQRDSEFIIRQAGLESLLLGLGKLPQRKQRKIGNHARSGVKSEALVERYFADLDRSTLDQLLKIYRIDFELFDYDYRKYYDMVHPWSLEQSTSASGAPPAAGSTSTTPSVSLGGHSTQGQTT
uniref:Carbohydrate sulfotransferase n=1 Tax=Drosophila rhopaloa TaxID=1041015 RepID=A0A6P4DUA6_DRORH